uniref:Peptidase S1 domain-containing protein n=1 Tax=Chromera velia CCMP2878 TaxID=1169474 RepID=A0A0G4HIP5_9ALVE|eukprot:Cvel_7039.t1-p1 / transcript=Cvel_7039.t1 / gene=Cvel_7039 / organism=Chromera_velia_CCMP2878 / gene_product=hypothetical protein / transcript_product=hypothetical protein / location=Cvel_scaffold359:51079-53477(-) / protein_length=742 / sequence_SO=supercontig / SO=protein_coding / is_pseudo=false
MMQTALKWPASRLKLHTGLMYLLLMFVCSFISASTSNLDARLRSSSAEADSCLEVSRSLGDAGLSAAHKAAESIGIGVIATGQSERGVGGERMTVGSRCAAWLVAPDIVVTAASCLMEKNSCERIRFFFDSQGDADKTDPKAYLCLRVLSLYVDAQSGSDLGLVLLDRRVEGRVPLSVRLSSERETDSSTEAKRVTVGYRKSKKEAVACSVGRGDFPSFCCPLKLLHSSAEPQPATVQAGTDTDALKCDHSEGGKSGRRERRVDVLPGSPLLRVEAEHGHDVGGLVEGVVSGMGRGEGKLERTKLLSEILGGVGVGGESDREMGLVFSPVSVLSRLLAGVEAARVSGRLPSARAEAGGSAVRRLGTVTTSVQMTGGDGEDREVWRQAELSIPLYIAAPFGSFPWNIQIDLSLEGGEEREEGSRFDSSSTEKKEVQVFVCPPGGSEIWLGGRVSGRGVLTFGGERSEFSHEWQKSVSQGLEGFAAGTWTIRVLFGKYLQEEEREVGASEEASEVSIERVALTVWYDPQLKQNSSGKASVGQKTKSKKRDVAPRLLHAEMVKDWELPLVIAIVFLFAFSGFSFCAGFGAARLKIAERLLAAHRPECVPPPDVSQHVSPTLPGACKQLHRSGIVQKIGETLFEGHTAELEVCEGRSAEEPVVDFSPSSSPDGGTQRDVERVFGGSSDADCLLVDNDENSESMQSGHKGVLLREADSNVRCAVGSDLQSQESSKQIRRRGKSGSFH